MAAALDTARDARPDQRGTASTRPSGGLLSASVSRVFVICGLFVALSAIVLMPRGSVQSPGGTPLLLALGVILCGAAILLVRLVAARASEARPISDRAVWLIVGAGVVTQIVLAFVLHPVQSNDSARYLVLAQQMAHGGSYLDSDGMLAYWPPGLPLFLVPFFLCTDNPFTVVLISAIVLYLVASTALFHLANTLFDRSTAKLSLLLFTFWPSRILMTTFAAKETLTIALVTASLALAISVVPRRAFAVNAALAATLGLTLGFAALSQPGLALLFCGYPIVFWSRWKRLTLPNFLKLLAIALIAIGAVVGPWIARNHRVFDGRFTGISTNGGDVFYRANNDRASAEYSSRGTVDLAGMPELEKNRRGFELGKEWILGHPVEEAVLSFRKFAALVDNDSQGVYWGMQRRLPATAVVGGHERMMSDTGNLFSYWFWMFVCAAVALRCAGALREHAEDAETLMPLLLPILYCAVVFSLFESGARQHMFAGPALIVITASVLVRKRSAGLANT